MAITKILARKGGLRAAVHYVMNGDKTEEQLLVATHLCTHENAAGDMLRTKELHKQTGGVQYYHMIQSFKPGEITPELALEIAQAFVREHLSEYEAVIGVHTDRQHVHSHIVFNSVRWDGKGKYHSNARTYYNQIRAISDRLCGEHGLSVIMQGNSGKAMHYYEWLRQSKGQPTYRSMLEADLNAAMEDANDIGHFFMLMENKGYEVRHGNRLGFRLRGQERFMYPQRKNAKYSEEGIRTAIAGNLLDIEHGLRPVVISRPRYRPYQKQPKYKGFLALYVHYLYILGKVQKQQYPPRMTGKLKQEVMRFEELREQFKFLRENGIESEAQLKTFQKNQENQLQSLTKQRTILNVQKKKRKKLFDALTDEQALASAKRLYEEGHAGMEAEYVQYRESVEILDSCGVPRAVLTAQKVDCYKKLADLNREIRQVRKKISMCQAILEDVPQIEKTIQKTEPQKEVKQFEHEQR